MGNVVPYALSTCHTRPRRGAVSAAGAKDTDLLRAQMKFNQFDIERKGYLEAAEINSLAGWLWTEIHLQAANPEELSSVRGRLEAQLVHSPLTPACADSPVVCTLVFLSRLLCVCVHRCVYFSVCCCSLCTAVCVVSECSGCRCTETGGFIYHTLCLGTRRPTSY